jgi:hypothetical protein
MYIPSFLTISRRITFYALVVLSLALGVSAQKVSDNPVGEANPDIDQCADGKRGQPMESCTGNNWQNGNINENNAQYVEGDSVPFRVIYTGLTPGQSYTIRIAWDTTKGGKAAYDYLTSYNRTVPPTPNPNGLVNDPCSGVTGCSLGTFATTPIPIDPHAVAGFNRDPNTGADGGASDNITQIPGVITGFGVASFTAMVSSDYLFVPAYNGDSTRGLDITFVAGAANAGGSTNVVIAWGGHIATRKDWGINNSAVFIGGSPYHMRLGALSGGQDRSLKTSAVLYPAIVTIVKIANPYAPPNNSSNELFAYSTTGPFGVTNFTLQDNNNNLDGNPDFIERNVTDFVTPITVTEQAKSGWQIGNLSCTEANGGLGTTANSTPQYPGVSNQATATIIAQEGEIITCTYTNVQQIPSAAPASIGGRVTGANGRGISGVYVTLTNLENGTVMAARTNTFGYYSFQNVESEVFYQLKVAAKRYEFPNDTTYFTLSGDSFGNDFIASN